MKRCNACSKSYRGAGRRVLVPREGKLVSTNVCPDCAGAAVLILVQSPTRDARLCAVCHEEPAQLGERCAIEMRKRAAAEGRRGALAGTPLADRAAADYAERVRRVAETLRSEPDETTPCVHCGEPAARHGAGTMLCLYPRPGTEGTLTRFAVRA